MKSCENCVHNKGCTDSANYKSEGTCERYDNGFWTFLLKASEIAGDKADKSEWGKIKKFVCPICNGNATAVRSTVNGHLHTVCECCGMAIIE